MTSSITFWMHANVSCRHGPVSAVLDQAILHFMGDVDVVSALRITRVRTWERRRCAIRSCVVLSRVVVILVAVIVSSGCNADKEPVKNEATVAGDAAIWVVDPATHISSDTTAYTALVTRVECNNGDTGVVLKPDVRMSATQAVVTFRVAVRSPGSADCRGNNPVPYEVKLPEALGDRDLVDGQCLSGGKAANTEFCAPDGVRFHTVQSMPSRRLPRL